MEFNVDKCSVIHLGKTNPSADYRLFDKQLTVSDKERDLGVIVDNKIAH